MFYVALYLLIVLLGKIGSDKYFVLGRSELTDMDDRKQTRGVNFLLFNTVLLLSFVAAFRSESVGIDTKSYTYVFNLFKYGDSISEARRAANTIEYGYLAFAKIVASIWSNRVFFFFCNAIIIYTGFINFQKKNSDNFLLSVSLFVALYYTSTFNVMRQYLAISIFLLSVMLLQNKKYVASALLLAVAFAIHKSLIIVIPIWILYLLKIKKKGFVLSEIIIILFLVATQKQSVLNRLLILLNYQRLTNKVHFYASDSGGLMAYIYFIILLLGFCALLRTRGDVSTYYYCNLACTTVGTVCAFLANTNEMYARAGSGYQFFMTLLFPEILEQLFGEDTFSYKVAETVTIFLLIIAAYVSGRGYTYTLYTMS